MGQSICTISGCGREHVARGWCNVHYRRWRRNGDPLALWTSAALVGSRLADRFWSKVDKGGANGCWLWAAYIRPEGYGQFQYAKNDPRPAHRVAWELTNGTISDDLTIDHLCRVRNCVNPGHLEPVPIAVNVERANVATGRGYAQTHCRRGHAFSEENTRWRGRKRKCVKCERINSTNSYRRSRARALIQPQEDPCPSSSSSRSSG